MRDRLMVGHGPLKAGILVRIQVPQLTQIRNHPTRWFLNCISFGFEPDRWGREDWVSSRVGNYSKPWVLKERKRPVLV